LQNSRLTEISQINERFVSVLDDRSGVTSARITSARELSESEKTDIKTNLEKLTGKTVNLNFNIDKNIIGGVIARIGSTIYDGSVKTQLEELREKLIKK
jgi:F-type H+-transporting ATPase subunit delta